MNDQQRRPRSRRSEGDETVIRRCLLVLFVLGPVEGLLAQANTNASQGGRAISEAISARVDFQNELPPRISPLFVKDELAEEMAEFLHEDPTVARMDYAVRAEVASGVLLVGIRVSPFDTADYDPLRFGFVYADGIPAISMGLPHTYFAVLSQWGFRSISKLRNSDVDALYELLYAPKQYVVTFEKGDGDSITLYAGGRPEGIGYLLQRPLTVVIGGVRTDVDPRPGMTASSSLYLMGPTESIMTGEKQPSFRAAMFFDGQRERRAELAAAAKAEAEERARQAAEARRATLPELLRSAIQTASAAVGQATDRAPPPERYGLAPEYSVQYEAGREGTVETIVGVRIIPESSWSEALNTIRTALIAALGDPSVADPETDEAEYWQLDTGYVVIGLILSTDEGSAPSAFWLGPGASAWADGVSALKSAGAWREPASPPPRAPEVGRAYAALRDSLQRDLDWVRSLPWGTNVDANELSIQGSRDAEADANVASYVRPAYRVRVALHPLGSASIAVTDADAREWAVQILTELMTAAYGRPQDGVLPTGPDSARLLWTSRDHMASLNTERGEASFVDVMSLATSAPWREPAREWESGTTPPPVSSAPNEKQDTAAAPVSPVPEAPAAQPASPAEDGDQRILALGAVSDVAVAPEAGRVSGGITFVADDPTRIWIGGLTIAFGSSAIGDFALRFEGTVGLKLKLAGRRLQLVPELGLYVLAVGQPLPPDTLALVRSEHPLASNIAVAAGWGARANLFLALEVLDGVVLSAGGYFRWAPEVETWEVSADPNDSEAVRIPIDRTLLATPAYSDTAAGVALRLTFWVL